MNIDLKVIVLLFVWAKLSLFHVTSHIQSFISYITKYHSNKAKKMVVIAISISAICIDTLL